MKVEDWTHEIEGTREALGLSADKYPTEVLLAFVDIESDGNPDAHREGSQYYGLVQIGKYAGLDAGVADTATLAGADADPDTEDDFFAFYEVMERYADRHDYVPARMAVLWKGGAGTAALVDSLLAQGVCLHRAIEQAERQKGIPRLQEYVRRFSKALLYWKRREA
jgi:hypothetical protein